MTGANTQHGDRRPGAAWSSRAASTLGLLVDAGSGTVHSATVAGRNVPTDRAKGKWAFGFRFEP